MQGIAAYADNSLVPPGAISSIRKAADMLEGFGREGDIYVVHAAEGETVVPMEVLNSSPKLKAMLFQQMTDLGLEPERYVVGNELNSINPVTGKPEFFLKKLFKGIKSVFKKAAPILGAIAGTFLAPGIGTFLGSALGGSAAASTIGTIAGKALGSGIGSFAGSKLAGADTSSALRNALISGGTAGAFGGFQALTAPQAAQTAQLSGSIFGESGSDILAGSSGDEILTQQLQLAPGEPGVFNNTPFFPRRSEGTLFGIFAGGEPGVSAPEDIFGTAFGPSTRLIPSVAQPANLTVPYQQLSAVEPPPGSNFMPRFSAPTLPDTSVPSGLNPDRVTRLNPVAATKGFGGGPSFNPVSSPSGFQGIVDFAKGVPGDLFELAKANKAQTAMLAGGAGLGILGALEEQKKAEEAEKAASNRRAALDRYIADATARYQRPYFTAEQGGTVPGKGRGDIVPAMLEPGEFVMNRKAVIGAGDGSQKAGIKRMYAMMRQFEGKA